MKTLTQKTKDSQSQILREKAAELLKKAQRLEDERAKKIGKLVMKYADSDFMDFNLDKFKEQIKGIE